MPWLIFLQAMSSARSPSVVRYSTANGASGLSVPRSSMSARQVSSTVLLAAQLIANEHVPFVLTPERKPKPGAPLGTLLTFAAVQRAGHYQVTLSADAWIDLIQDGKMVPSYDHSGGPECPGVRAS